MSGAQPLISVVIPTYNHAQFLNRAIKSVVEQTYTNWQALVINNYSNDDTIEIVSLFRDPRIELVNFRNNGIIASSRNEGIRLSKGEFVAFLDSDDAWVPEKLAKCLPDLVSGNDLVCHGELWTDSVKQPRAVMYGPSKRASYDQLLYRGNCISTSATIVRKSLLDQLSGFDHRPSFVTAEDYDLWLRIAKKTNRLTFVSEVLGEYTRHGGNASASVSRHLAAELSVLEDHFSSEVKTVITRCKQRNRRARAIYGAGRTFDSAGATMNSLKYFAKSFFVSPFVLRLYPAIGIALLRSVFKLRAARA